MARERGSVRWHRGGWEVRAQVDGRRVTKRHRAPNTRAGRVEAEKALDALLVSLSAGTEAFTVAQMLDRHKTVSWRGWAPSTRASHKHHAAPIVDAIGSMPLADLRKHHIQALYDTWAADGTAPGTVARRHTVLAAALNMAEADELILRSPAAHVRLPKGDDQAALDLHDLPPHAAVAAGIARLAPDPATKRAGHRRLQVAAALALATGCRRGELVALRWSDVDLAAGDVRVRSAISVDDDGKMVRKLTKGRTVRTIRLDPAAVADLKRWQTECKEAALEAGVGFTQQMPVLPSPSDPRVQWHPDRVTKTWDRHRKDLGLPTVRFHDLRHRHATTLLEAGIPVHVVSARLGHATPTMTLNRYAHAVPAGDQAAADAIAAAQAAG